MTELAALDDRATVQRLDPKGLLGRIEALPEQCEEAWRRASSFALPRDYAGTRNVVLLGMGGSAIASDVLRSLALGGRKPVHVVRGYDLPSFAGKDTLAVACSHSGNTEETLSAFEQALAVGAKGVAITTGGGLRELAEQHGVPILAYQYDGEPRSALGHQLMALLVLGQRTGLLEPQDAAVAEAAERLRALRGQVGYSVPAARNAAKQLAGRLQGRLPVIVGAGVLAEAARRWKTQLNENSKCWAIWEELPELDHNTIVGFGLTKEAVRQLHVVFISHLALHPRVLRRYDLTAAALSDAGVSNERVEAVGESPLAQALSAIHLGDFVSYYLALLYGVDPSQVDAIAKLKAGLADS
jgi:glucose/mannose-6-phosphate isomerase